MQVRVITLRYSEGLQGFPEEALRQATAGHEVLEVREHFFVHANAPHVGLVVLLGDSAGHEGRRVAAGPDPGEELPEHLRPLYRELRQWRNERAKNDGVPSYAIARNVQLADICRRLPRTLADLKEVDGIGEGTCAKYGRDILARIPAELGSVVPAPVAGTESATG